MTDLRVESASGVPQLQLSIDRDAASRQGVTAGELAEAIRVAIGGEVVSELWQGQRNYGILVRAGEPFRSGPAAIEQLPLTLPSGMVAPIGRFARAEMTSSPSVIRREHVTRRIAVEGSVEGRDLGSAVSELRDKIAKSVTLPSNYYVDFGGQFEQQQRALGSLAVAVAIAVGLVFILLFIALGSMAEVFVILLTLPDALRRRHSGAAPGTTDAERVVGGRLHWTVWHRGAERARFDRADPNAGGEGLPFADALRTASIGRVRPKLMTAGCAMLGLLPLVLSRAQGRGARTPARDRHDWRVGHVHTLHVARLANVLLSSGLCADGSPRGRVKTFVCQ